MSEADPEDRPAAGGPEAGGPGAGPQRSADPPSDTATGDLHAYIGTRLREAYEDVAKQPIPDRFLELMRQLDEG